MSDSNGADGGGNDMYQYSVGQTGQMHPTFPAPGDASHDSSDGHALLDLGGLGSLISGLIEVDVGTDSTSGGAHTAALIDVGLGGEDVANISIHGGADMAGGSDILGGLGGLDASCLLDGLLCDGILS